MHVICASINLLVFHSHCLVVCGRIGSKVLQILQVGGWVVLLSLRKLFTKYTLTNTCLRQER